MNIDKNTKSDTNTAILFPGQGSQKVGMGKNHYEENPHFKKRVDSASDILNYDLAEIMFEGPAEKLKQTQYTQPAIFVHSLALFEMLNLEPGMTAGHSLGEFTALAASKALSFEDALTLVSKRGFLMQRAGEENPGTMAALIGMKDDEVQNICEQASNELNKVVNAANFNSPGQVVISGDEKAIDRALEIAKEEGCRLAKKLPVSGAFHTSLMEPAYSGLKESLEKVNIADPICPVYCNYSAEPTQSADQIRENLLNQLMNPVLWTQSVLNMDRDGAKKFIEVGPGNVLRGLVKRTLKKADINGYE